MTTVILADTSGSMETQDAGASGAESRYAVMRRGLAQVLGGEAVVIGYSDDAAAVNVTDLPAPFGGTFMAPAIREARKYAPDHTWIISDGAAWDREETLQEHAQLPGSVGVIYCGPPTDNDAHRFLISLVRGGRLVMAQDEETIARAIMARDHGEGGGAQLPASVQRTLMGMMERAEDRAALLGQLVNLAQTAQELAARAHDSSLSHELTAAELALNGVLDREAGTALGRIHEAGAAAVAARRAELAALRGGLQQLGDAASRNAAMAFGGAADRVIGAMSERPREVAGFRFQPYDGKGRALERPATGAGWRAFLFKGGDD